MPWIIYQLAGGASFLPGVVLLLIAVFVGGISQPRRINQIALFFALLAVVAIALSAVAIPFWIYGIWAAATLAWAARGFLRNRRAKLAVIAAMVLISAVAAAMELPYRSLPTLPAAKYFRLYVLGDSISAGLNNRYAATWPTIIWATHHVEVIDMSRAGATLAEGSKDLKTVRLQDGLVIIELGGNDMLARTGSNQFGRDLEQLVRQLQSPSRDLVMFELPLLPFNNDYGIEQRRIASTYHIALIPRQYFVDVLASPNATMDGLHLTATGQQKMAELVWRVTGQSLKKQK